MTYDVKKSICHQIEGHIIKMVDEVATQEAVQQMSLKKDQSAIINAFVGQLLSELGTHLARMQQKYPTVIEFQIHTVRTFSSFTLDRISERVDLYFKKHPQPKVESSVARWFGFTRTMVAT